MNCIKKPFGPDTNFFLAIQQKYQLVSSRRCVIYTLDTHIRVCKPSPNKIYENYFREEIYADQATLRIAPVLCTIIHPQPYLVAKVFRIQYLCNQPCVLAHITHSIVTLVGQKIK